MPGAPAPVRPIPVIELNEVAVRIAQEGRSHRATRGLAVRDGVGTDRAHGDWHAGRLGAPDHRIDVVYPSLAMVRGVKSAIDGDPPLQSAQVVMSIATVAAVTSKTRILAFTSKRIAVRVSRPS